MNITETTINDGETVARKDQFDKFANDSFELWRITRSKFPRDQSKKGIRNYAYSCLDDFLFMQCNLDLKHNREYRINLEPLSIDIFQSEPELLLSTIYYSGYELKINGNHGLTAQQLEMLEDLLRLVQKYEFNYGGSNG